MQRALLVVIAADHGVLDVWGDLDDDTRTGIVYAWGAQVEQNASLSSSIPATGAAPATRALDLARVLDASWLGNETGTVAASVTPRSLRSETQPVGCLHEQSARVICIARDGVVQTSSIVVDDAQLLAGRGWTTAATRAFAVTWAPEQTELFDGDVTAQSDTAIGGAFTTGTIGSDGTRGFDGYIRSVAYWPRELTSDERAEAGVE